MYVMVSTTHMPTPKCHLSLPTPIPTQPLFASRISQVVLIPRQMNETPKVRMRVAHTSLGGVPIHQYTPSL